MKGHRAERPVWVFNYSIIFQIYGCATSSTVILGLGVPTNVLLQHIVLIAFIKYSNLKEKSYKHGTDIVYNCTMYTEEVLIVLSIARSANYFYLIIFVINQ